MKYFTGLSVGCMLLLLGCATPQPTAYQESSAESDFGYNETKLTETQYRIEFVGNRFTEESQINDYAMLRAAEVTIQKGYDWFTILTSETDRETKTRPDMQVSAATNNRVTRKCGLLGCSSYVTSDFSGAGINTNVVDGKATTTMQISMGSGEAKNPSSVFNAKELAINLRNKP